MKKLLSMLFILGSVSMLANETAATLPADDADALHCYEAPCSVEKDFKVRVKVPEKLVITAGDIDLGLWCGDTVINVDKLNHHTIKGEKGKTVKVKFKDNGALKFKKGSELIHKFAGTITHKTGSVVLDPSTGEGKGGVNIQIPKTGNLEAGQVYTASATLQAEYDTAGWTH